MKRKLLSLALAGLLVFSLAGCQKQEEAGGGQDQAQTQDQDQDQEKTQEKTQDAPEDNQQPAEPAEEVTVRVAALKGPTAMGMVKWMEDAAQGQSQGQYEFTLAGAPDQITGGIVAGDYDAAAVPANLAAVLYNKTQGQVQLAALNTLGVLYLVESGDQIQSAEDLRGRTIYATGKGSTPEYALNYVLTQNGLTPGQDVQVEYKTEHAELAALLASGQADLALLPQPFVTSALAQNENLRVALDLTELWDQASQGKSALTMGCLVVRKEFAQQHPQALKTLMEEYGASVAYVTDEANVEQAAALIEKNDIIKAAVAQKALPQCNIVFIAGEEMRTKAEGFYQVLMEADPAAVGGELPGDDFYYQGQ